jgi:hypothetical protein
MEKLICCCVNTGNYLGRGYLYVRALEAQLEEYLTVPYRFVCVTDTPIDGVECVRAEHQGWWEKLRLFKPGVLPEGRKLFLDLDTFIVGNIDFLADYRGEFAILRDFYRTRGLGSAVMLWDELPEIYDAWIKAGKPQPGGGDQAFVEDVMLAKADRLQDLYPGKFVSYKVHCANRMPPDAAVICFHGNPKPHAVNGWAGEQWSHLTEAAHV